MKYYTLKRGECNCILFLLYEGIKHVFVTLSISCSSKKIWKFNILSALPRNEVLLYFVQNESTIDEQNKANWS